MHLNTFKNRAHAGDTIIEVMIALAIIGTVISVSYATAQRSLKTGQAAQERIEALKVAESQVETLKSVRSNTTAPTIYTVPDSDSFCLEPTTGAITTQNAIAPNVTEIISNDVPTAPNSFSTSCKKGFDGRYHVSITRETTNGAQKYSTFTVRVLWSGIIADSNNGIQELNLVYKLHEDQ